MRIILSLSFVLLPIIAFAQARAPQVTRTNPPTLSKPTGYTHIVEVTGPNKSIYISGQIAYDMKWSVPNCSSRSKSSRSLRSNRG